MNGHKPHNLECFPVYTRRFIIHYTCNAPKSEVIAKKGIVSIGHFFGCANPREVLQIPEEIYFKYGFYELCDKQILQLNLEKLMSDLK